MIPKHKKLLLLYKTNLPNELIRLIAEYYPVMNTGWIKTLRKRNKDLAHTLHKHYKKVKKLFDEENETLTIIHQQKWIDKHGLSANNIRVISTIEYSTHYNIHFSIDEFPWCECKINKNKNLKLVELTCDGYRYADRRDKKTLHEAPQKVLNLINKFLVDINETAKLNEFIFEYDTSRWKFATVI